MGKYKKQINEFMTLVQARNEGETEFLQAIQEVAETIIPYVEEHPRYKKAKILERMIEAERIISFRVPWISDSGEFMVNRGYRVQMNSAIGPYKGGLRFHPSVNQSILKFLAFEQIFKNSLSSLPMGAGKGGADFDPKGKSDHEIMKFCQSFMVELSRHVGNDTDVPAGDIGVGSREIGYMFGQYKRINNHFIGVLTGKGISFGGSLIRPEATGYGTVYFAQEMLKVKNKDFKGLRAVISGSGNVAQYACEKLIELGAKVVTMSDSKGYVYDKNGITSEKLAYIMELKNIKRRRIEVYAKEFGCEYYAGQKPWGVACELAFPCATQNELNLTDAKKLLDNGMILLAEGANMPTTPDALELLMEKKIMFAPGKASNAGGVATSGLEMSQNSSRLTWTREEVDGKLREIMVHIHQACVTYGQEDDYIDYVKGANIAGFIKVADAMLAQGHV
jgi:glutamate dehydrogenase (NADP+)